MLALPSAVIDDGQFEICHVGEFKRFSILRLFPKYMKGLHTSMNGVQIFRSNKIEVIMDEPVPMNLDGEINLVKEAKFEIFHKGLPFIVPANV